MKNKEHLYIFDTTLRDGEQCPGASMNEDEKLIIAHQLAKLKVDIIEAGFPVSSPVQFRAVERISNEVRGPQIAALARTVKKDITEAYEALKPAPQKRIHTFIATSNIHMKHKLNKKPSEVLNIAVETIKMAFELVGDVEFSAEDATRSELNFLIEIVEAAIDAGASTINLPDTVGYTTPQEYSDLFNNLTKNVSNIEKAILSAHCHNDLGMAVANSLHAVQNGARQVECTINGIGERAGNTAMEEVVMTIKTRSSIYPVKTNIQIKEISKTSRMVSNFSGLIVQRNKAIVGANAFAHESGIHQDGMLKNRLTYEIMTPESIGLNGSEIILGRHSGRAGFMSRVKELGSNITPDQIEETYQRFLQLADQKKEVFEEDLAALLDDQTMLSSQETYRLERFHISSGSQEEPQASVTIQELDEGKSHKQKVATMKGDGPISALFRAIEKATGFKTELENFSIVPTSKGKDSLGTTKISLKINGKIYHGKGVSTDIFESSAKAFLDAVNRSQREGKSKPALKGV